jgi:hypothetical protein
LSAAVAAVAVVLVDLLVAVAVVLVGYYIIRTIQYQEIKI